MTYEEVSDNFVKKYDDDLYQAIFETFYDCASDGKGSQTWKDSEIYITDIEWHGRIRDNATFYGYLIHRGNRIDFRCQDGNSRGSIMQYFEEELKPKNYFPIFYFFLLVVVGLFFRLCENKEK